MSDIISYLIFDTTAAGIFEDQLIPRTWVFYDIRLSIVSKKSCKWTTETRYFYDIQLSIGRIEQTVSYRLEIFR